MIAGRRLDRDVVAPGPDQWVAIGSGTAVVGRAGAVACLLAADDGRGIMRVAVVAEHLGRSAGRIVDQDEMGAADRRTIAAVKNDPVWIKQDANLDADER